MRLLELRFKRTANSFAFKFWLLLVGGTLVVSSPALAQDDNSGQVVRAGALEITVPDDWYAVDIPPDKPKVRSILASDEPAELQALLIISVVPKQGRTLETFTKMSRNYILTRMDGEIHQEESHQVKGSPAITLVYEGRSEYHAEQGRRTFRRTIVDRGPDLYILHAITEPDSYERHRGTLEEIVNSVKWVG